MSQTSDPNVRTYSAHAGPPPGWVGVIYVALFVASLLVGAVLTGGAPFPTPFQAPEVIQRYFESHADSVRITSFIQFGSAIPLGLFAATMTSRLKFLGVTAAGSTIAQFGGFAASGFLALSGLTGWVLSQPDMAQAKPSVRMLELLSFATGGPGHVVPLGLLLAGVSVPGLLIKLLPRWVAILGLVLAVVCELSTFSLVLYPATLLVPIGRFGSFVWLIASGFTLPKSRA